ncbi:MAG: FAD-dependent oxidoreductase [Actinomycetes bacterium]
MKRDVVVVGAGIAGLAAASELARAGIDVTILEESTSPGGRMRSVRLPGGVMEIGAQFLSSDYQHTPHLVDRAGLSGAVRTTSKGTGVVIEGKLHTFRSDRPMSMVTGGLLPLRGLPAAIRGQRELRTTARHRGTFDLAAWASIGNEPATDWAHQHLGRYLSEMLLTPTIMGFYFQHLAASSAALPAAVATFGGSAAVTLTLEGGLGRLTAHLAEQLEVHYQAGVSAVVKTPSGVRLETSQGTAHARRVILALPGGPASRVHKSATPRESLLMQTPYSSGLLVGLSYSEPLGQADLGGCYGVLVHPQDSSDVAALAVRSRAHQDSVHGGDVVTVMFKPEVTEQLAPRPDTDVTEAAKRAVDVLSAGLGTRATDSHVVRWEQAMPTVPRGHANTVKAYRLDCADDEQIILAGDYLGFPWSDSAAFNGIWAAGKVLGTPGQPT